MTSSPFIVVRYANGSGGRFLSTVLQLSKSVAFWNRSFESAKSSLDFSSRFLSYVDDSFPTDPAKHLLLEPDLPYCSDFYSGTYNRGDDIDYSEYTRRLTDNNDDYFFENIKQNKKVNLILHRSKIPNFMLGSIFVNIIIDTPRALKFVHDLLWAKHFEILSDQSVLHLPDDPTRCNPKRKTLVEKYANGPVIVASDIDTIYKEKVVNNPELKLFSNTDLLYADPSNIQVTNTEFYLDNIFNEGRFIDNILLICSQASIDCPDLELLKQCRLIWFKKQMEIIQ